MPKKRVVATDRWLSPRQSDRVKQRLTSKFSMIMIAIGEHRTRVYQSMDEVPEKLRDELRQSTEGANSATILIADRGGREEILRAVRQTEPERFNSLFSSLTVRSKAARHLAVVRMLLPLTGRLLLVGCLGYVLWVLATVR